MVDAVLSRQLQHPVFGDRVVRAAADKIVCLQRFSRDFDRLAVAGAAEELRLGERFRQVVVAFVGALAEEDEGAAIAVDGEPGEVSLGLADRQAQGRQGENKAETDRRERHCLSSN